MLVSVVGAQGSAPRKTQSHMLVNSGGRICGTVGGGAVEGNSIVHAKALLENRESGCRTFELYEHAVEDIGMICGGRVDVHFQYIACDDESAFAMAHAALSALQDGTDGWLVIDTCRHLLTLCIEDNRIGADVPDEVIAQLGPAPFIHMHGDVMYYAEQFACCDRVYVFGGGHVAQALVPLLASVDFRCVVIEDRAEFCSEALFPAADEILLLGEDEWKEKLSITSHDCICIMTHGHENDLACQAFALETDAAYIGVIGSRRKIEAVNARLRALGFDDAQIARITTPIGLEIGAVTPNEIAVSIAAQMIAHRAARRKEPVKKSCMA